MGLIAMSERDLQRIEILSKVIAGRMTLVSAAHVLDLSERQVRRLLERISTGGAASIRHKAIGRPSNNRISDGVRDYAVTLVRERYADFGPTQQAWFVLDPRHIASRGCERQVQRVGDVFDLHGGAQLPGDDVSREVVQNGRQIKPAPADNLEIGKVGLPELVGPGRLVLELVARLDDDEGRRSDEVMSFEQTIDRSL